MTLVISLELFRFFLLLQYLFVFLDLLLELVQFTNERLICDVRVNNLLEDIPNKLFDALLELLSELDGQQPFEQVIQRHAVQFLPLLKPFEVVLKVLFAHNLRHLYFRSANLQSESRMVQNSTACANEPLPN